MYKRIASCRICGNQNLVKVLDLGEQALTGRFPLPQEPDPSSGPLELVACMGDDPAQYCGLLQLSCSYVLSEMYGSTYGYRSSLSQTMVRHLSDIVEESVGIAQLTVDDAVLDIGCNDGTLLKFYEGLGVQRTGIDPSSACFASSFPNDIKLIVDFFSAARVRQVCGDRPFKIVTSIAMFYDLEDPVGFMREVRSLLAPDGIWVSEQAYARSMIENVAFDSVCHEHLNYYNLRQMQWMAQRAGLKVLDVSVNDINGTSFRIVAARDDSSYGPRQGRLDKLLAAEARFDASQPLANFSVAVDESRATLRRFLQQARRSGKRSLGYGASTKGNVVLQYCGLTADDIPAIAEKHPGKFGHVTPATRIPIISEADARGQKPDHFIVFPWHLRDEIVRREERFVENGGKLVFPLPRFEVVESQAARATPVPECLRRIA
jgi:SAM-dependent methyltransferase